MIQWTCEQAAASSADTVIVATDDTRIKDCVESFGFKAVMTSESHQSGTDRIAEAIQNIDADLIINLQGDEPILPPKVIDELITKMKDNSDLEMATVAVPGKFDSDEYNDPNTVKVVKDINGKALYFSRSPIPYVRNNQKMQHVSSIGVYTHTEEIFLEQYIKWPQSELEKIESLEQLRALENGASIQVVVANQKALGVDVPEDIAKVENFLKQVK